MASLNTAESTLCPALEPFAQQQLTVGGGPAVHFEQCGNPGGFPAIFLHGGPGSHTQPLHRRFFDPQFYRIVLSDQRGCGRSVPLGCTEENTTRHLVEDIEALRGHLGLERLMLFGGSWGATLALAYAAAHPQRVAAMVLRGVFFGTRAEVDRYLSGLGEGGDVLARYHQLVNQRDEAAARAAALRWVGYEEAVMSLDAGGRDVGAAQSAAAAADPAAAPARAGGHRPYPVHDGFLGPGDPLRIL